MAKQWILRVLTAILTSLGCHSQSLGCGRASLNPRIVGGVQSSPGSWPWFVSLRPNRGDHICGGSLINNQWVLTAAHCMKLWFQGTPYFAYLGRHNYSDPNPFQVERRVSGVYRHPSYDEVFSDYDMCLLELEGPVSFSPYIQPVCLAARGSTVHSGVNAWVAGFGVTEENGISTPSTLQEVSIPIVGDNKCKCSSPFFIPPDTICAGLDEGGKDACQGDSGSPLVVKQDSVWVQAGVVSTGEGCARPKTPGVYSEVSLYQDWIESTVAPGNQLGFVKFTSPGEDPDKDFSCNTTATPNPTTSSTTTTSKSTESDKNPSVFDHAQNVKTHLSQLLFLCGLALSPFALS